jgi:hypothetical protein
LRATHPNALCLLLYYISLVSPASCYPAAAASGITAVAVAAACIMAWLLLLLPSAGTLLHVWPLHPQLQGGGGCTPLFGVQQAVHDHVQHAGLRCLAGVQEVTVPTCVNVAS